MSNRLKAGAGQDGQETSLSEDDIVELCRMGVVGVRRIVRPDTVRIAEAFDDLMAAVKRRSRERHQDTKTAIERCFAGFAGRGKTKVSVRKFAEKLSILSIQWSDNFSREECIALAEGLCCCAEHDNSVNANKSITVDSFRDAVEYGVRKTMSSIAPSSCLLVKDKRETKSDTTNSSSGGVLGGTPDSQEQQRAFNARVGVEYPLHEATVDAEDRLLIVEGSRTQEGGGEGAEGSGYGSIGLLSASAASVLTLAVSEARSTGVDVWRLLDEIATATPTNNNSNNNNATSSHISRQALLLFLSKLGVNVLEHPPSPSTGSFHRHHHDPHNDEDEATAHNTAEQKQRESILESSPSPTRHHRAAAVTEGRGRSRAFKQDATGARYRGDWLTLPSDAAAAAGWRPSGAVDWGEREEGRGSSAPSSCDRYIRQLSDDTASVRCRLEIFTRELARTRGEAEALFLQTHQVLLSPSSSPPASTGESEENNSERSSSCVLPTPVGSLFRSFATTRPATGRSGGEAGRADADCPSGARLLSGRVVEGGEVLERLTPVEPRTDPSHPRVDLAGSSPADKKANLVPGCAVSDRHFPFVWTEKTKVSNPRSLGEQHGEGHAASDDAELQEVGRGAGGIATAGQADDGSGILSRRCDPIAIATATATAASHGQIAPAVTSSAQSGRGIIGRPADNATLFDPPSIRNGLKGLSTQAVDRILLGVEHAAAGSKSCWRTPRALECSQVLGKTGDTISDGSASFQVSAGAEKNTDMKAESVMLQNMRRVIRAPKSARGLPLNRRNRWDIDKMKWVGAIGATSSTIGNGSGTGNNTMVALRPSLWNGSCPQEHSSHSVW